MKTVYKTAALVTLFSLAEKGLGSLYRIYLSRAVGSEGIGLYQIALSVFAASLTLVSSGIPATETRLITKYRAKGETARVNRAVTAGILVTVTASVLLSLAFTFFPNLFSFLFADERCKPLFSLLVPVLTLNAVYSVFRGVFWGNRDFLPYAVIELIEEATMIVVGIVLISRSKGVYEGAKSALFAVCASYAVSFTLGTLLFLYRGGRLKNPRHELRPLLSSSLPITAMRSANSLVSSFTSVVLPLELVKAGLGASEATAVYGAFCGLAMPLLYSPMTFIGPFTIVLIPQIAENFYKGNREELKKDIEKAVSLALFFPCLLVPVFALFGEEIGVFLFSSVEGGVYTARSAPLMILLAVSSLSTSILNSIGEENKTLLFFIVSNVLLLLCAWLLPRFLGVYALLIGYYAVYGLNTLLNLFLIKKKTGVRIKKGGFAACSLLFLLPTTAFGFFLKSLLLYRIGAIATTLLVSALMLAFIGLLYGVFGLVDYRDLLSRLPFQKKKKAAPKYAQPKNRLKNTAYSK